MKKIVLIERLKAFAILSIVLFHYARPMNLPGIFKQAINFGGTGVHLFVLLSGFGLYLSHLKKPLPYFQFLKKRLTKVYVPYIIVVLFSAALLLWIPLYEESSWYALFGHIFMYKMFDESIVFTYGYHLWFISMILQYYFLFHILVWLKDKLSWNAFIITSLLISLAWWIFVWVTDRVDLRIYNSSFFQFVWEFALGMYLAFRIHSGTWKRPTWAKPHLLIVFGLLCAIPYAALALFGGGVGKVFNDWFAMSAFSFIAVGAMTLNTPRIHRAFEWVGGISYSLYLLHYLPWLFLRRYFPEMDPVLWAALGLTLTILLSSAYQTLINRLMKVLL